MVFKLVGNPRQIVDAINAFPAGYHAGFAKVRSAGRRYIAERTPTESIVLELAKHLREILKDWGAGGRKASQLREEDGFVSTFLETTLHASLAKLGRTSLLGLNFNGTQRLLNGEPSPEPLAAFDTSLLWALNNLSEKLFDKNTNVTYPMKSVLLISGFMPAFDSQVRQGLKRAGFEGIGKTQFLLPPDARGVEGKKVTRLPFILGQCWAKFQPQLQESIQKSKQPRLSEDPGRIFDVLLFMQGSDNYEIFRFYTEGRRWYDLR